MSVEPNVIILAVSDVFRLLFDGGGGGGGGDADVIISISKSCNSLVLAILVRSLRFDWVKLYVENF